jgi:hypothetical protein
VKKRSGRVVFVLNIFLQTQPQRYGIYYVMTKCVMQTYQNDLHTFICRISIIWHFPSLAAVSTDTPFHSSVTVHFRPWLIWNSPRRVIERQFDRTRGAGKGRCCNTDLSVDTLSDLLLGDIIMAEFQRFPCVPLNYTNITGEVHSRTSHEGPVVE